MITKLHKSKNVTHPKQLHAVLFVSLDIYFLPVVLVVFFLGIDS